MYRASGKRQELEAQGSGGAPQPAESTADASQLGGLPIVRLKVSGNGRGKKLFFRPKLHFSNDAAHAAASQLVSGARWLPRTAMAAPVPAAERRGAQVGLDDPAAVVLAPARAGQGD